MTGKQLRNSILQCAIQGKLVPQDPNDEPASVLLERIRVEKARLVKEKKIKKDKNETIIYRGEDNSYYEKNVATGAVRCIDDEIPFDIPQGWEWCRIKDICSMQAGKNISASEIFSDCSSAHPYRCVGGNGLRGYVSRYNTSGHNAIVGRQGALCGCLNLEDGNYYATEHAVVVDTYDILSPEFMYYFLTALNLNQYATATAQPGLAVSNIIEVLFPLPPYGEQARIIQSLKQLQPKLIQYEAHEGKLNILNDSISIKLKSSILQDAIQGKLVPQIESEGTAEELLTEIRVEKERLVKEGKLKKSAIANESRIFRGDDNKYYEQIGAQYTEIYVPFDIPDSWRWVRMGNIGDWGAGATPLKSRPDYYGGNILWLRTGELNNGIIYDTEIKITDTALEECSLRLNQIGDVLVAMYGATIGKLGIAGTPMTSNQACCGCHPFLINNKYLFYFLMADKDNLVKRGEGGAQPNISKEKLLQHLMPLPPLSEQYRIVERVRVLSQLLK